MDGIGPAGGAIRGAVRTGLLIAVISTALAAGAVAASSLYREYGPPAAQTATVEWAMRSPLYDGGSCAECHGAQTVPAAAASHDRVGCESCHPPGVVHPDGSPGIVDPVAADELCVTCHVAVAGRPDGFSRVDTAQHYPRASCLRCHDPHTAVALTPPDVTHPLANLPACTTCHAPGRLKRFPSGHEPAPDRACLTCHQFLRPES